MRYELIGNNDTHNIINTILKNRGVSDPDRYLNLSEDCIGDWNNLDNIQKAVECFAKHFKGGDDIAILVDCDP